jgi:hypothetical protein
MCPHVFLRPMQCVENVDPYFNFRYDVVGRARLSGLQKCVAAIVFLRTVSRRMPWMSMFVSTSPRP